MRTRGKLIGGAVLIAVVIALVVAAVLGRPHLTDQQKLYALVAQAQKAVENRNATGLTRLLAQDYADSYGTNRRQLVGMIVQWMRSGEEVLVVPEITDLQIREPFADMSLRVRMWRGREPSGRSEECAMTLRLRQEGRDWRVVSAEGWPAAQSHFMDDD
jgi:hypothetical protein